MVTLSQLGCGYWGPNLLRNFSLLPDCHVKWVAEESAVRRAYVQMHYPRSGVTVDWREAIGDSDVDAVVIATPASTHYDLVREALQAGRHVLVEKPLAMSVREADELVALAERQEKILMVGHTFLYNAAVRHVRRLIEEGALGDLYYFYSQRLNLGQVRQDVNVWWNLAPHDVSILVYWMGGLAPREIRAHGVAHLQPAVEDVVFAALSWGGGISGHVHVSWLDPGRVRRMTVVGSRKMVVYDDVGEHKITVLDKGVDRVPRLGERMDYDHISAYTLMPRAGDILVPRLQFEEPVRVEAQHFLDCIRTGERPLTDGRHGRDIVAVLEAGSRALRDGATVSL
ncbi:MAG: Gfo/Idh/MocA family oxidoreductase [Nitrospirae bacterium]|nr:Gfo/Idh/MocA family oxidoreductase [Nitrospirota bacterium]